MNCLAIVLPVMALALVSCDKAKKVADAARVKMGEVTDQDSPATPGGSVSPELAGQVDSAAEGVRFRRDLPFPTELRVRVTERMTFRNARVVTTSELGPQVGAAEGTWEKVGRFERDGGRLLFTIEKAGKVVEESDQGEGKESSAANSSKEPSDPISGTTIQFQLGPKGWRAPDSGGAVDFKLMSLEQSLRPSLPSLLTTHGLSPRPQWFSSSRRWIGGDRIELGGESIALLFPGQGNRGKVTLVYEVAEAIGGHPCARFSVEGNVILNDVAGMDGVKSTSDITISSGKIWCSLIHPLVLREEFQTVLTSVEGSGSGPKTRVQGGVEIVVARSWEP